MIRLNTYTIFRKKQNKFGSQHLYFLRDSKMRTQFSIGSEKIFPAYWGHKIVHIRGDLFLNRLFHENIKILPNRIKNFFDFIILNLISGCFQKNKLPIVISYILSSRINFCNSFCKLSGISFYSYNFISFFAFNCIFFKSQRRHALLAKLL